MNLPNKLTIARVIAVPFFIAAYLLNYYIAAFLIFIVARSGGFDNPLRGVYHKR